jgi:two-component system, chemotaxis family, chemotaxis protein CheY
MQALIVEDSRVVATILRARLERVGLEVAAATNASEGWNMFQSIQPQLVTLDIVMPNVEGMDSFSLLERICKKAPDTAVFVVSGSTSFDDREKFTKAGAMGFISKPFVDFEKFLDRLGKLFPGFDGKAASGLRKPPRLNVIPEVRNGQRQFP